jgi:hypothetical protein
MWLTRAIPCLLAGLCFAGCRGASFDGRIFRGDGFAFQIPQQPRHYHQLDHSGEELLWRDARSGGRVLLAGRCGTDRDDVPLAALTQHLFLQFTERKARSQDVVPFDQREAMHTIMDAKLDGVPLRYDAWVLKKDDCIYDLLYFNDPQRFDAGLSDFRRIVAGFATVKSGDD